MQVIDFYCCGQQEYWLEQIKKSDWSAGSYLYELLSKHKFHDTLGKSSKVLMLVNEDQLLSFCTYAEIDDIQPTLLTPWIGFVYTFPQYRGHRYVGKLFQEIEKNSEYEYLILDLTDSIMDLWEVLKGCDYIYTISRDDGLSMAKIEQYERVLEQMEYGEITARTTKWRLPIFKQLPRQFEELTYGELAKYIRSKVFPDLLKGEMGE